MTEQLEGTLRVLAYEGSFPEGYIGSFLRQNPALRFVHVPYDTDGEAIALLAAGEEADVLASCVEETLAYFISSGYLQPIDVGRLTRWNEVLPWFRALPGVVEGDRVWMVPVDSAPTGLTFDTTQGPPPASFADLFDESRAGRIAVDAKPVIALHVGALALGIPDPPSMAPDQLERVKAFYLDLKRDGRFPVLWETFADIERLYRDRTVVASSGFPGDTLALQRAGLPVGFAVASEGSMLFGCGFAIGRGCRNEEAAYAFLDDMLGAESQSYLATQKHFIVSNGSVLPSLRSEIGPVPHLEEAFLRDAAVPAPPDDLDAWNEAWREVLEAPPST
ncbi:MAG: extracellular solute-binding protein [Actinomycetota bacterium]